MYQRESDVKWEHTIGQSQKSAISISFLRFLHCWRKIACLFRSPFFARFVVPFHRSRCWSVSSGGCPVVHPYGWLPNHVGSRRASKRFLPRGLLLSPRSLSVTCQLSSRNDKVSGELLAPFLEFTLVMKTCQMVVYEQPPTTSTR